MMAEETAESMLQDLLSGDSTRILTACGAILRNWDLQFLTELASHVPEIREKTKDVALGGALHPNSAHLANAIRRMEFARDCQGCLCTLYADDQFSNPSQESDRGHVKILETKLQDGNYVDYYICECQHCGARHQVTERDYHYTWWGWSRI